MDHVFDWSALAIATVSALWGLLQYKDANQTKKDELRWRQVERADLMLEQILGNPEIQSAFSLLDWDGAKLHVVTPGEPGIEISWQEQDEDLRQMGGEAREMFVRESFDTLYEAFERLEHAIRIGVVRYEDIAQPFKYYVVRINWRREAFMQFEENWEYELARKFIARFPPLSGQATLGAVQPVIRSGITERKTG